MHALLIPLFVFKEKVMHACVRKNCLVYDFSLYGSGNFLFMKEITASNTA